jgi:hypothetical protein
LREQQKRASFSGDTSEPEQRPMNNLLKKPLFWIILIVIVFGLIKVALTMFTVSNVM